MARGQSLPGLPLHSPHRWKDKTELAARDPERAYSLPRQCVAGFLALETINRTPHQGADTHAEAIVRGVFSFLSQSRRGRDLPTAALEAGCEGPVCCPTSEGTSAGGGRLRDSIRGADCPLSAITNLTHSRAEVAWETAKEVKPSRDGRRCSW